MRSSRVLSVFVGGSTEKTKMLDSLINLSDLRSPAAQFEETRKMKRYAKPHFVLE